ncbi:hypothetical protein Y032_0053g2368 [Ancylostoma ceylanicum]|uniref:Uncharacterized protein n=1 Tax=Ancylostoma ceylanicum TaxID=53326 RepID=A0A016U8I3_9BILA|nr:hypothetical protein Y032_0053g2368 [Ancylostoma ceylanicum]
MDRLCGSISISLIPAVEAPPDGQTSSRSALEKDAVTPEMLASEIHRPSARPRRALSCSRPKKYLPLTSTARLLSRAAPPMHYHTCCDVAQSTRSLARGKYFLERLYVLRRSSVVAQCSGRQVFFGKTIYTYIHTYIQHSSCDLGT